MSAPSEALGDCSPPPSPSPVGTALVSRQVDVEKLGTEAAAAVRSKVNLFSGFVCPMTTVCFNRPFLFSILSKDSQSIIFWGKVINPSEA